MLTPTAVAITALVAALILVGQHWLPWALWLRRDLTRIEAYALGTLALVIPQIVLFLLSDLAGCAVAVAVVTVAGGVTVLGCYLVDGWAADRAAARQAEERERGLR